MKRKVFAIIQARMGSERLPGKVLKELCGRPMLYHIIRRVEQVKGIGKIVIATSVHPEDDAIAAFAESEGVFCFRGSEEDVLGRYFEAAKALGAEGSDIIMRLTADNPLVDPLILKDLLSFFEEHSYRYATVGEYPLGIGGEVFTFQMLTEAFEAARKPYEREHVTPYMYRIPGSFGEVVLEVDDPQLRFTVDTPQDFAFVNMVYRALYHGKHDFYLAEILDFLHKNPEIKKINASIHQKQLGE